MSESPDFNSDLCRRVCLSSAVASTAIVLTEIGIMLAVDSAHTECPGWWLRARNGSYTPIWLLVAFFGALPCLQLWHIFVRWERVIAAPIKRQFDTGRVEGFEGIQRWARVDTKTFPYNFVSTVPMMGFALFSGIPLLMIAGNCTTIPRHFG